MLLNDRSSHVISLRSLMTVLRASGSADKSDKLLLFSFTPFTWIFSSFTGLGPVLGTNLVANSEHELNDFLKIYQYKNIHLPKLLTNIKSTKLNSIDVIFMAGMGNI